MSRPPLEVADLIRAAGTAFFERRRKWFTWQHLKILNAIVRCRTSALGGHVDECSNCGHRAISFNSCRNRHCPKCQANARDRWLEARRRELLPTRYVHVVFTLPAQLAPLALQNKREVYSLLFRASAETLLAVARNPRHLGAEIGFFSVLHTWNQKLLHHPHVHCVVPAGGLAPDHSRWIAAPPGFFLPAQVLSRVFRGKFVAGLRKLHAAGGLTFHGGLAPMAAPAAFAAMLRSLFRSDWVVYAKAAVWWGRTRAPIPGLLHAPGRNLESPPGGAERREVAFRWRDSAHKNKKRLMRLSLERISAAILPACATQRLCADPAFRVLRPPAARVAAAALLCALEQADPPRVMTPDAPAGSPAPLAMSPDVAARWRLWNDSAPPRRGLRSPPAEGAGSDDLLFAISNPLTARARPAWTTTPDLTWAWKPPHPTPDQSAGAFTLLVQAYLALTTSPGDPFKTHNGRLPKRLTSSRCIENAPAPL